MFALSEYFFLNGMVHRIRGDKLIFGFQGLKSNAFCILISLFLPPMWVGGVNSWI